MSEIKMHDVRLNSVWHVEVKSVPSCGYFILIFHGETEKGKRYKIHLKMELYFIKAIARCLLDVRGKMREFFNDQFGVFKDE